MTVLPCAVIAGSTRNPSAYSVNSSPALFGGTTPR